MVESVIGAKTSDLLHQTKTKEGSLTVSYNKRDIIANTIGHVLAIPTTHSILWTWGSAFKNPSQELAAQLFERYKDVPWKGDVLVRVGHTSILGDMKRVMARNESVRGRPWNIKDKVGQTLETVGKMGAVVFLIPEMIKSKFLRSDFYNPFSNTVSVYHPKLAAGMHELGHAEFFNQMENKKRAAYYIGMINPILPIPFFRSYYEWKASEIALKRFKTDTERRQGLKMLEGAWATYMAIDSLTAAAIVAPALALPLLNLALNVSIRIPLGSGIAFKVMTSLGLAPYGASLSGHLMNRLYPKKSERFGYVFSGAPIETGKESTYAKKALGPHQVYASTARAA